MDETIRLVLEKGKQVIRFDAGSAVMFQPDQPYVTRGGAGGAGPIEGPLAKVRDGEAVLRSLITQDEHVYSGQRSESNGGAVNEALTPIHGHEGVIGALCLGRNGTAGFTQRDLPALDELGSMAGIALENSIILQAVTGQASNPDTPPEPLGASSQALPPVPPG